MISSVSSVNTRTMKGSLISPFFLALACNLLLTTYANDTPIYPIPTECPEVDPTDSTVHIAHEYDCTKFYTCAHGVPVLTNCPGGLYFNPVVQVCDWPWNVNCTSSGPPEISTEGSTESSTEINTGSSTSAPSSTTEESSSEASSTTESSSEVTTTEGTSETTAAPPSSETPPDRDPECPFPDPLNYTVHLPHETDCDKFYKCDNGKKVLFDCPDGLYFNPELEVCDWPSNVNCTKPGSSTSAPGSPTEESTTESSSEVTTPSESSSEATAAPPSSVAPPDRDPECPFPDPLNYTVHLPHETDCDKFYKCDNGKKVLFDCPDGLYFNPELEVCDWPWNVNCTSSGGSTSTPSSSTEESSSDVSSTTESSSEVTTPSESSSEATAAPPSSVAPPDRDPECPFPDPLNYTVHLPHETDCDKFYKCDNGKKVLFDCPDGLYFNPELEVCDWPWNVNCTSSGGSTSAPSTSTEESGSDVSSTTESASEVTTPSESSSEATAAPPSTVAPPDRDSECPFPDPLNYTVHLPHETDCDKFYKCDNGKKVLFDCPDGLYFNPELEVCDWPWNVNCTSSGGSTSAPSTSTEESGSDVSSTTESASEVTTPSESSSEATAAPPSSLAPPDRDPECPFPDPLNYTVHLPHETDCDKFYKCDNGKKVLFDCPDGLYFNPELEVCDWPWNVNCTSSGGSTSAPSTSTEESGSDVSSTTESASEVTTPSESSSEATAAPPSTVAPPDRDSECPFPDPLNYTVHLPHETDCDKFYKCDNGKKVLFDCPDGLYFNPELEVCDWPWNVNCTSSGGSTSAPSTSTEESGSDVSSTTESASEVTTPSESSSEATAAPPSSLAPPDRDPECPFPDPLNYTVHLPHETDCDKFYKCDNGKKVLFDCPDGLYFNPELEVCDWPWNVNCTSGSTSAPPTKEPSEETTEVPSTTEPSTEKPSSTSPSEETTEAATTVPPTEPDTTLPDEETTEAATTAPPTEASEETTYAPSTTVPPAEETTEAPTTVPDTTLPDEETTEAATTAPPTEPSEETTYAPSTTVPPAEETTEAPTTIPPTEVPDTTLPDEETTEAATTAPPTAPSEETTEPPTTVPPTEVPDTTLPDEGTTEAATTAPPTEPSEETTDAPSTTIPPTDVPETTLPDEETTEAPSTTIPPSEETTEPPATTTDGPGDSTTEEPTTEDSDGTTPSYTTTPALPTTPDDEDCDDESEEEPPKCPKECPDTTLYFPHEKNYRKYYRCEDGDLVEEECPKGLAFDADHGVCNIDDLCPIECEDPSRYLPVDGNEFEYVKCEKGEEVIARCPSGLVFDPAISNCNRRRWVSP